MLRLSSATQSRGFGRLTETPFRGPLKPGDWLLDSTSHLFLNHLFGRCSSPEFP